MNQLTFGKLATLLLVFSFSTAAFAKVGTRNLEEEIKHEVICMPVPVTGTSTAGNGGDGLIFKTTINAVSAPTSTAASAGAPSTFPWPALLTIDLLDSAATSDTLTCTSVIIKGQDQFGTLISETVTTISETAKNTTKVFSSVSSIVGAGCAGASDAGDVLVVYQSPHLGLTRRIAAAADIEAACIADASNGGGAGAGSPMCARLDNGGSDDISSAVSLSNYTLNTSTAIFGVEGSEVAAAADDIICLRIRSSFRAF